MNLRKLKTDILKQIAPKHSPAPSDPNRINILTVDGELSLPPSNETKHTLVVGATGSGKSMLIAQFIDNIQRRGDRAVVLDLKGEFTSFFYRPGIDMILNPLDERTIKWTVANDINFKLLKADAEVISNSLINDLGANSENEKFFLQAGKNVLKGLIYHALSSGTTTNRNLADTIFTDDYEKIKEMLQAVEAIDALSALGDNRGSQADGVLATAHTWSRAIELLSDMDGDFSIAEWIKNGKGLIFLNANQKYQNIVNPLARFFIDFLLNTLLGLGQDINRRIFIILDEFPNLAAIPSLISILGIGRSAGASVVAGCLDFGLVDQKYGQNAKTTLMNAMNTLFLLRVLEPNTAEYLSKAIGESEVEDYHTTSNLSENSNFDAIGIQNNHRNERLILPTEFTGLKDLEFYFKTLKYLSKSKLVLTKRAAVNPAFVPIQQAIRLREAKELTPPVKGKSKAAVTEKASGKTVDFS